MRVSAEILRGFGADRSSCDSIEQALGRHWLCLFPVVCAADPQFRDLGIGADLSFESCKSELTLCFEKWVRLRAA